MKHPEWALKHKRKGTELRHINGTYYLYEVTSKWNPEKKRPQKITGRLLGKITPEGFIESPKYALSKRAEIKKVCVKEYGATRFLLELISEINEKLKEDFPSEYMHLLVISALRLLYETPLKNMKFYFEESYLSETLKGFSIGPKRASKVLKEAGRQRDRIVEFLRHIVKGGSGQYLLIDATHLLSHSEGVDIARVGYNSKGEYVPQVNLLFIYSRKMEVPVYYRIVAGDIREVKAFRMTLREAGLEDAILIGDKGFYSSKNIEAMRAEGLRFIVPLKRNNRLVDYGKVREEGEGGI